MFAVRAGQVDGVWSRNMSKAPFGKGMIRGMALAYLVQHGEKEPLPGDPGLTGTGRQQATRTGRWLLGTGVRAVFTSPMRRARETADCIASVTGLAVQPDARLGERLNWDGSVPFDAFLALWARAMRDRDWAPAGGQCSRQAGARLEDFLAGLPAAPGLVAVVTHGGITVDLLRNLLGDEAVPPHVLTAGIPPCAITVMDDLNVVTVASASHLS
jgi:broad specificity phosphatase PhoE